MSREYHTCRKCRRTSYDPSWDMYQTGPRHWEHFSHLTMSKILTLPPSTRERFETWWEAEKIEWRQACLAATQEGEPNG